MTDTATQCRVNNGQMDVGRMERNKFRLAQSALNCRSSLALGRPTKPDHSQGMWTQLCQTGPNPIVNLATGPFEREMVVDHFTEYPHSHCELSGLPFRP